MMKVVVDRFEGEIAVCETEERKMINIERSKLPDDVCEGDSLMITDEGIAADISETERKRIEMDDLTRDLWK
jgi:pyruvate kinase